MKNYKQFVNESKYDYYWVIHNKIAKLNNQASKIRKRIRDLQHSELNPILIKVIDSNNKEMIQKVIDYKPKDLFISIYQFLHQKMYQLNNNIVPESDTVDYEIPYTELDDVFKKIKKQADLLDDIDSKATELLNEIIETNDLNIIMMFNDVVDYLPSTKYYKKFNKLVDDRENKNKDDN